MALQTAHPDQLQVGVYISLEQAWMDHPFLFNAFKIRSTEQLAEIKALGLPEIQWDPVKSDVRVLPPAAPTRPADAPELINDTPAPSGPRETNSSRANRQAHATKKTVVKLASNLLTRPEETLDEAESRVAELAELIYGKVPQRLAVQRGASVAYQHNHNINVTLLSLLIAGQLNMPREVCVQIGVGAMLHDIGFIELPPGMAQRALELGRGEEPIYMSHCQHGLTLAKRMRLSSRITQIIYCHHERLDGSGYPHHLRGDAVPTVARIVAIADRFDELVNPPGKRPGLLPSQALAYLFSQAQAFDIRILRALVRCVGRHPPGSLVRVNDGQIALVKSTPLGQPSYAVVQLHDPATPPESAPVVTLTPHGETKIGGSLDLADVPAGTLKYLRPSAQVSYYLEQFLKN